VTSYATGVSLVIGFDLDMTLLDTRPGIAAAYRELATRTGVPIDVELVVSRLGPPLRQEMAEWFAPEAVEEAVVTYRALYPDFAIAPAVELPGARAALQAVHQNNGKVIVVTSKLGRLAELHLAQAGLAVDEVHGDVFAAGKAAVLVAAGAAAMVGDHLGDMQAAGRAGIPGVGVTTGPCTEAELLDAGATVVLPDLLGFPDWLARMISVGRPLSDG
jgi:phosphoglycolate phosphatase